MSMIGPETFGCRFPNFLMQTKSVFFLSCHTFDVLLHVCGIRLLSSDDGSPTQRQEGYSSVVSGQSEVGFGKRTTTSNSKGNSPHRLTLRGFPQKSMGPISWKGGGRLSCLKKKHKVGKHQLDAITEDKVVKLRGEKKATREGHQLFDLNMSDNRGDYCLVKSSNRLENWYKTHR